MPHRHIAEVGIVTADADRLVAFYQAAFGFSVERVLSFEVGVVHRLVLDDARCKIFQPDDLSFASGLGDAAPPDPWYRRGGIAYGALHVADVAIAARRAHRAGGVVLVAPTSHRPDAWFCLLRDPDGNCWELLTEVPDDAPDGGEVALGAQPPSI